MDNNIYIAQFETGSNINLLPLAAGQLYSRLRLEEKILEDNILNEIIFKKQLPTEIVSRMNNISVLGLSCSLWNTNMSLAVAEEAKVKFPDSLIVVGGPSVPKNQGVVDEFFMKNPFIDVLCLDEGEEVFTELCRNNSKRDNFSRIPGIIYKDKNRKIKRNPVEKEVLLEQLPSPFIDGTFDSLYSKHKDIISGAILEINRGCPYKCSFCTWGICPIKKIRSKSKEVIEKEVEWIGKNKVGYISMADANFGIKEIDLDFVNMLVKCKEKYDFPKYLTVSWVKNNPEMVLKIADKLREADIGFRITSALQSTNKEALRASNRHTIKKEDYDKIRDSYKKHNLYSYTELILGLPEETYESYIEGIESLLSPSIFDQLYIYPLLLYHNTEMSTTEKRKEYGIESRIIEAVYTKSKAFNDLKENMEIVVGTSSMPKNKWVDAFVVGYSTLALHDDRLAFFSLNYLKKEFGIKITDLISYARDESSRINNYPIIGNSFSRLENCALGLQNKSKDHLIRPVSYGGIPFDPPEGVFLELLLDKKDFYSELLKISESYLSSKNISYDKSKLQSLFNFQEAVMAGPLEPSDNYLNLDFNWTDYFSFAFNLEPRELKLVKSRLKIVDANPSYGDSKTFLKNHFSIRGVPAFNSLYDEIGKMVFPPVKI